MLCMTITFNLRCVVNTKKFSVPMFRKTTCRFELKEKVEDYQEAWPIYVVIYACVFFSNTRFVQFMKVNLLQLI